MCSRHTPPVWAQILSGFEVMWGGGLILSDGALTTIELKLKQVCVVAQLADGAAQRCLLKEHREQEEVGN